MLKLWLVSESPRGLSETSLGPSPGASDSVVWTGVKNWRFCQTHRWLLVWGPPKGNHWCKCADSEDELLEFKYRKPSVFPCTMLTEMQTPQACVLGIVRDEDSLGPSASLCFSFLTENENSNSCLIQLSEGLNETILEKYMKQHLTHSKYNK